MKKIIVILILFCVPLISNTQINGVPPKGIYHSIIITSGSPAVPIVNQLVNIQITITSSVNNSVDYIEEHSQIMTDDFGSIVIIIGNGTPQSGTKFNNIKWSQTPKFLKTEFQLVGASSYTFISNIQILSVPYALKAGPLDEWVNIWDFAEKGAIIDDGVTDAAPSLNCCFGCC